MKIELRDLMDKNEMLSHIFLGCIKPEKLVSIREKYVGTDDNKIDWRKESVKIPVEMKIGGVPVNPKEFFDSWKDQMKQLILDEAQKLVAEKLGSHKMREMQNKLYEYEKVLKSWEEDINWDVKNPLITNSQLKNQSIDSSSKDLLEDLGFERITELGRPYEKLSCGYRSRGNGTGIHLFPLFEGSGDDSLYFDYSGGRLKINSLEQLENIIESFKIGIK